MSGPTTDSSNRKARRVLIVLMLAVGLPAIAFGVFRVTVARSPFDGLDLHDFGIVRFVPESKRTVEHVFELTNRTDEPVIILQAKPSCGCAAADLSSYLIDPGETLELTASLDITKSGLAEQAIGLVTKRRGVRVVHLRATGRWDPPIMSHLDEVRLRSDESVSLPLTVEVWGDPAPDPPLVRLPDGASATVDAWVCDRVENARKPAIWSAKVRLEWTGRPLPDDATITITAGEGAPLVLPVVAGS